MISQNLPFFSDRITFGVVTGAGDVAVKLAAW
jgi:hypothetical protein